VDWSRLSYGKEIIFIRGTAYLLIRCNIIHNHIFLRQTKYYRSSFRRSSLYMSLKTRKLWQVSSYGKRSATNTC
jgi:hypothetical protein